jgi:Uma2 family endonuclease
MMAGTSLSPQRILENGDRLSRAEFERRYTESNIKKAELIEGVVYVASPLRFTSHGEPHGLMCGWLFTYQLSHPGLRIGIEPTVRLDPDNEVQPDVVMFREGGGVQIDADGYLTGAPDLIVEVAASSASYDMHAKKDIYQRNGVKDYIVWRTLDQEIDWFVLENGIYQRLEPDPDGILVGDQFKGLRLNVRAMLQGDMTQVLLALRIPV